jgi:uncharacterized repeat protein (TIGR01451 family)
MTRLFPRTSHSNLRVFLACLLSFMTLIAPIASVAAATGNDARFASATSSANSRSKASAVEKLESFLFTNPSAAPAATPDITAIKTASFADADSDGKAEFGQTITYNVNVTNNGPVDATNVTFTDTVDANTTFVPGSLKVSPLAFADTYVTAKNTVLNVGAPGVLGNDTGTPAPTVTQLNGSATLTGSTTGGGTVTIFADGHFDYTPNATFEGADTFTYTVSNGQSPDSTATVTINVDAAPTVTATTPLNGALGATTSGNITVTFSEPVNVTGNWFQIVCATSGTRNVADTVVTGGPTTFTINPNADFTPGESCTVTIDDAAISDQDSNDPPDNMAADYSFTFTMDAAPIVTATTPISGATDVATSSNITVTFSEPVNVTGNWFQIVCATSGTRNVAATVVTGGPTTFTINPNVDFTQNELCTVTVFAAQVADQDSNDPPDNMAANYVFSYTIDAAPTVSATSPVSGATNVAANANIQITFSENVNVTASAFTIQCPTGSPIAYTLSPAVPGGTNLFTLDPNADLPGGVTCTVTVVANQVTDTDTADPPDQMVANHVFTFSVDAAPSVTSTTPANNATQQANNANITINFSEDVAVSSTDWFQIVCASSGTRNPSDTAVTGGPASYTINPSADFTNGETCTVTVFASKVTDVDANDPPDNMAANHVFSFTIDTPPAVSSTSPADNASNISVSTNIDITFNEPVDATASSFNIQCPTGSGNQAYALSNNVGKTVYTLNPNANLPAGAVCTVTVVANQISDVDAGDPPDNMTGDYVFSFKIPPVANDDAYPQTVIGNVNVSSFAIPYSITTNDLFAAADPITITKVQAVTPAGTTVTATTVNGGTVVVTVSGADIGKFTYNPPAGFEGNDTFTYEITNGGGTSNAATVTIPVAGMVWFINNSAAPCTTIAAGCGRLTNPFSDLGDFSAINNGGVGSTNPAVNDNIFIYQSATAYNDSITLLTGQKLIGQDSTSSLSTLTGLTPPSSSAPFPTMFPADGTITKITTASGAGITLNSVGLTGSNVINGLTVGNTAGAGIFGTNSGSLTVADVSIFEPSSTRTGQAIFLDGSPNTIAVNASFGTVTSSSSSTTNVTLSRVTGTINLGTGALSGSTGNAFSVSGAGNTANISYAGTITNSAARAVNIVNKSGGTVSFSGLITSSGSGIFLDTNTGATINFTGGMNLSTGANTAFTATGGGTVSATQNNTSILNRLTTTTGTALNVQNTTIGASGLTFRSINSPTSGGNTGIILSATGSTGTLTVTGVTGSTCTSAADCSGGVIANKTGGDGSTTGGIGIYLNDTQSPSFSYMQLNDFQNFAILGTTVRGFTLENSIINGTNGTNENFDEGSVAFTNLTGAASIKNVIVGGAREDTFRVINTTAGSSLNRIVFDNVTFNSNNTTAGDNGLFLQAQSSATMNVTVKDSDFNGARGDQFQFDLTSTAHGDLIMTNNNFINTHPAVVVGGGGITLSGGGSVGSNTVMTYDVDGNTFRGARGDAILVALQTGGGTFTGKIRNNTIGLAGTDRSGSSEATGIEVRMFDDGVTNVTIDNNQIRQYSNFGILLQSGGAAVSGGGSVNATVSDNTIANPSTFGFAKNGIQLNSGTNAGDAYNNCVDILNNTTAGSGDNGNSDIQIRHRFNTTVHLPGYGGSIYDTTAVQNYMAARNTGAETVIASTSSAGGGYVSGVSGCGTPVAALDLRSTQRDYLASAMKPKAAKPEAKSATQTTEVAQAASTSSDEVFTSHGNVAVKQTARQATQPVVLRSKTSEIVKTAQAQPMAEAVNTRAAAVAAETFTGHASSKARSQTVTKAQPMAKALLSAALPAVPDIDHHPIGTIPSGRSVTISFQVTVKSAATYTGTSPQVSNQGTVEADNPNGGTLSVQTDDVAGGAISPTVTPVDSQPDLQITKTDGAVVAVPGGPISYTLAYNNTNGKRDANNVVITETIPANTVFNAGASDAGWSCPGGTTAGNTCTLAVGSILAGGSGGSAIFAVTVVSPVPAGVTQISNIATIADDGLFGVDGNTANNTSTVNTSLNAAINLSISKSDGNTGATAGQNITYTLTYANSGNKGATGVVIHETVPANSTFNAGASTAGWSCAAITAGSACTFNVGNLAGGAGSSVQFVVTVDNPVPGGTTQISNTATINDDGANGADADAGNNSSNDTTPFDAPPTIGTYSNTSLFVTEGTTVSPTVAPNDDKPGFTVGVASSPGFTGGLSVNQTTGVVTITNAGPASASPYTITVTVTDSISQTTTRTFDLTVSKSGTTTTVTSSHPTLYINQTVTYTATVASNTTVTGPPTGTVDFFDGASPIGTCTGVAVNGSGQATCSQTYTDTVGSPHSITATYNGDSTFATSTSSALSQTVSPALNLTVNTTGDQADANIGDGLCDVDTGTVGSQCTLRAAIQETNSIPSPDTISFSLPASSTITLSTALPNINGDLSIVGPGAGTLTVKRSTAGGTLDFRIFAVNSGKTVSISGLTVTNGRDSGGGGGGILNQGTMQLNDIVVTGNTSPNSGAGIFNSGASAQLTIGKSSITGNTADENAGGIFNSNGQLTLTESTISGNTATGDGGGIASAGSATITNTTISGNNARGDGGGMQLASGNLTAVNITVTANRADSDNNNIGAGGGIFVETTATVLIHNSIVAGNSNASVFGTSPDVKGALDSSGLNNLIGIGTNMTGLTNGNNGNQVGTIGTPIDARLGTLANNGGPTQTHALLPGSPALDAGSDTAATNASLATDQRGAGYNRFADSDDAGTTATVDIGAFEAQVAVQDIGNVGTGEDAVNAQVFFNVSGGVTSADVTATSSDTSIVPNPVVSGASSPLTLTFNPVANKFGDVTITVTVTSGSNTMTDTFVLTVSPVADQPSVTPGSTTEDTMTPAGQLVISRNMADGSEVSHFLITGITNGTLYQNNGTTPINNGDFITFAQGNAGLRFLPAPNSIANGSFTVQGSIGNISASGPTTTATITVGSVNDQPTLDAITPNPLNILEDAGAQNVSLSGITDGGGEGQTLVVTASSNNTGLIPNPTVTYTSPNTTGSISFTPVANASGTADITVTVNDNSGGTQTISRTFTVNVAAVNDAPSFTKGPDQTVGEDAGAQTVNPWATAISAGAGDTGQTVAFQVTGNTNTGLFASQPAVSPAGVLTYTPAANASGTATITIVLTDNGGTANGGQDTSAPQTFNITVSGVNDAPSFTKGADQTVNEDSGAQTINPWATAISAGAADESGQTLSFTVTNNNNGLFSAQPAVSPTGVLTFTPAANAVGVATVSVTLKDNGGTAGGGQDTSSTQTFQITVNGVNDAPSFVKGANQSVGEDSGAQSILNWATAISAGPADESGQTLAFNTTNDNNALFAVQPSVSPTGTLTYTPAANANGVATVSVSLSDNGGTANGGADTSAVQTFTITVNAANDAPVNTVPGAQNVTKNGSLAFNAANSNLISIGDIDAGAGTMQVTLTATNGVITLSGLSGLSFTVGDGTSDTTMTFTGTIANINNALNGLVFAPANGYDGPASLQIVTSDQGNTGTGGALTDSDTISITVVKGGVIDFSSATYTVDEGAGTATITLNRTDGSVGTIKVNYTTSNGTAIAGQDYTTASGELTFNNGETTKSFTVPITEDALDEANETVNLAISNAQGSGDLGTQTTAVLTITDNDPQPSLSISGASVTEGNSGTANAVFTVTLSAPSGQTVTVNYQTANGTASAPSDYQALPSTVLTFLPGETTKTITVLVNGDPDAEANETFFVNLSGATNATIADNQGQGTITSDDTPLIGLSSSTYSVIEDGLHATITVNRLGDLSQPARVDYLTSDPSGLNLCSQLTGNASSRCDYATTAGTLRFAAGETTKTIYVPIVDDVYLDGPEVFTLTLSNAVGGDLEGIDVATITITDNDTAPAPNPIDNDAFFIRQLYIDFLGREPEPGAVTAWLGILNHCAVPTDCDRIAVARGFVRSPEFQDRGFFVYRAFKTLGRIAHYNEFIPDMARVSGFLSAQDLEANKAAYIQMFMARQEFKNLYDSTIGNPTAYVDKLLQSVQLPGHPGRAGWIAGLTNGTLTREQVLRQLIDSGDLYTAYVNEAFIIMNYFGFLRRDADAAYLTWIDIFNHTNDDRIIISGFLNSLEYRLRFGP